MWRPFAGERSAGTGGEQRYTLIDLGPPETRSPLATSLAITYGPVAVPPTLPQYWLLTDDEALYAAAPSSLVVDYLDYTAASAALAGSSTYAVFHSAVLSYGMHGLLLPAPSGSGKTTLTAALVRAGFGYLSDEAALVDPLTRRVHAYPKLLSIKRADVTARLLALPPDVTAEAPAEPGRVWHLDPNLLSPGCIRDATTITTIVFPRYQPDRPTALVPLSRSTAALQLLRRGVSTWARPPHGVGLAAALVAGAACYQLTVNDVPTAVNLITSLVTPNSAGGGPAL